MDTSKTATKSVVLSIDAMGGDKGPAAVVAGLAYFFEEEPLAKVILHGDEAVLAPLVEKRRLSKRVTIRHAERAVTMHDKPAQVLRNSKGTSMLATIDAVREGEADASVSCGNTGALMALSMLRLRKAEGVNRPAIACLWPSRNPNGFNVMLDAGADIRADEDDLLTYALMGASYARNGMALARPRVGLLNVGTEEHKGRAELKVAHELIGAAADKGEFEYIGFVEGGDLPSDRVDVIVTDGFTGNVALKTGEGTARLISDALKESFSHSIWSKLAAAFAYTSLKRLKKKIDPRNVNGGVFLGLNGTVVKSHGGADAKGNAAAFKLAYTLGQNRFADKLAARVASAATLPQDILHEGEPGLTSGQEGEQN